MLYIVKTKDLRYEYLKKYCEKKYKVVFDDKMPVNLEIDVLIIPLGGIDEFNFIKGTNINLDLFLKNNKVKELYTGKVNEKLISLSKKYNFKIYSFYENVWYLSQEFDLKLEVLKFFLSDKLQTSFDELKILVVGNDYKSNIVSERFNFDIYNLKTKKITSINLDKYDVIIKFDNVDFDFDGIVVEIQDIDKVDLMFLLKGKNIFYINHLCQQYLTKSSAKLMYDCMVID